jgi:type I restriction enzyme S subunit
MEKIGDVCQLMTGGTPTRSNKTHFEGQIPWLVSGDIHRGEIFECAGRISDSGMKASNAKMLPINSVMIALNGQGKTRGTVALLRTPATCNQSLVSIYPTHPDELLPEFLYANLHGRYQEIRQMTGDSGNDRRGLNMILIRNIEIPIAPLPEQKRIVAILDEALEGIAAAKANAEKNRQNARSIFESQLQSVFTERGPGWVERPLGDLCEFLNGFAFKSGDVVAQSQTQLVRMGNLYGNQLDLDRNPVFYPDSFSAEHSRYVLDEGDIIMSLTGTTGKEDYGFAVRIPICSHALLMNQRIMKFDALRRDIIDDAYLLHYLRSRCFLNILYPTANGTRQANLSSVTMKLLPIPLRSLQEQRAIAATLDSLQEETHRLARIYERRLVALDNFKKSLLHSAFSGELTAKKTKVRVEAAA